MNTTIYINKEIAEKVEKLAKSLNRSRSAIVSQLQRLKSRGLQLMDQLQ
jgi:predicted transcriptional regulator